MIHVLLHARFVTGLHLPKLGFLVRGQQLVHLVVDASLLHRDGGLNLSLLRGQRCNLDLIESALNVLAQLQVDLPFLLVKGLHGRMLFVRNGLHLRLLVIGEIELLSHETHPVAFHAEAVAMHRWRRCVLGGLRLGDY